MWEPQHLTTVWASMSCWRDTFTLLTCIRILRQKDFISSASINIYFTGLSLMTKKWYIYIYTHTHTHTHTNTQTQIYTWCKYHPISIHAVFEILERCRIAHQLCIFFHNGAISSVSPTKPPRQWNTSNRIMHGGGGIQNWPALRGVETRRAREESGQIGEGIAPSPGISKVRITSRDNVLTNHIQSSYDIIG
jgi:hypothetical protein